jgi:HK97 gp10 family phage protein
MPVRREGKLSSGELKNKGLAGLDRGLILAGQLVAQRATRRAPIDTGRLKRSITQGRPYSKSGGGRAIDVGTNVEYARIQEFGGTIPAQVIIPRNAEALAFKWPNAPANLPAGKGGLHYFKKVTRPQITIPAQPYLRPAIEESKRQVRAIIGKSVLGAMTS